ncbi:MAG: choice-of-anchor Q domain-containing protein, partial [Anderseniella sp.]|nr:choice-of-anchor Q domain-containing protein [Anderseniella sp.]
MKFSYSKLTPVSAAVLMALGSYHAVGAVAPVLVPGRTLIVNGVAPVDAPPTLCFEDTDPATTDTFICDNLRSAVAHANSNGNDSAYDRILLANGSVHTLTLRDDLAAEAIEATDNRVGDLDIITPMNIETANNALGRATIQGDAGFNDRLLHITATAGLTNLILTKGQGVHMNGGAIYAGDFGNTTISHCLITDNFASWDGNFGQLDVDPNTLDKGTTELQGSGGGIYTKGPLTISLSTLSENVAKTIVGTADYQKNGNGGAIYASQALTITDSTIGGEAAANDAINGGGIQMAGGNPVLIERSTLSHNTAVSGGAMNMVSPAVTATIINSTISANHVTDAGGGINVNGNMSIRNTTIANNLQDSGGPTSPKGAGVNQFNAGTVTMQGTLLVNNYAAALDPVPLRANCGRTGDGTASVASSGGNLSTDISCAFTEISGQANVADAKIGRLELNDNALNGNFTHALLSGSPAIDRGALSDCPATDERGVTRPQGLICDVG